MRIRFKPTAEQRAELLRKLVRAQQPATALKILRSTAAADYQPSRAVPTVQSVHSDRFVVRVQLTSDAAERSYALKVYSDDFSEKVWTHARSLAAYYPSNHDGLCLPTHYLPSERMLVFPWVEGVFLSEIVDELKLDLLRDAAGIAASLHRLKIVPESPTTARMFVDETRGWCDRLRERRPETTPLTERLMAALERALPLLDPAEPAPIHGDMAAGQFLWTGRRLVLLDLDMFGYADPAYDAGHFVAQLERRRLFDRELPAHASRWVDCFRDAYLAEMPGVSPRNVTFYCGLTLMRKMYTVCRRFPTEGPELVPKLAARAEAALEDAMSPLSTS